MPQLELYENKLLQDRELPIQLSDNFKDCPGTIFRSHWHEHLEMHYIAEGEGDFFLNQSRCHCAVGDLLIANSSELHSGVCSKAPYHAFVIVFNMADLSPELAKNNNIYQSKISGDPRIQALISRIFQEYHAKDYGYKQISFALVLELLVYLSRNYVVRSLPEKDSLKRKKDLERLNTAISYIEQHFAEPISIADLAGMVCLSEDRFGHLFREGVGLAPLQYINNLRLKKAASMLINNRHTVTEVANAVGFRDYNHFGRLFRRQYGCTPHQMKSGKFPEGEVLNSGII